MRMLARILQGLKNRLFQLIALYSPGGGSTRVWLHRHRGVRIGRGAWIGAGALIETELPSLVSIGENVSIGIRAVVIAHFLGMHHASRGKGEPSVVIEDDVFVGPGVIILPNVRIGKGSVITAGTVVNRSIPAHVVVQGNPGKIVAACEKPLVVGSSYSGFLKGLRPLN